MEFIGYLALTDCVQLQYLREDGGLHTLNCYTVAELEAHAPAEILGHATAMLAEVLASAPVIDPGPEAPAMTPEEELAAAIASLSPAARQFLGTLL